MKLEQPQVFLLRLFCVQELRRVHVKGSGNILQRAGSQYHPFITVCRENPGSGLPLSNLL